eukprot:6213371-Pleurochrysis_carterae.AAC.3
MEWTGEERLGSEDGTRGREGWREEGSKRGNVGGGKEGLKSAESVKVSEGEERAGWVCWLGRWW